MEELQQHMDEPQHDVDEALTVQEAVEEPRGASEDGQPIAVAIDPAYEERRQRIFEYRMDALGDSRPLHACLAGMNSDLLDFQLHVGEILRQTLATDGASLDEIERHSRSFDLMLRLSKQVAQITQLEMRSRQDDSEGGSRKPR